MRKPILYICGALAAYSLWRWFSYSYLSSSFRKGLEDDNNDKSSNDTKGDTDSSESTSNKMKKSCGTDNVYAPTHGDTDFTIMSSHAYDYSEENEVHSHKDSFNESKASFLKDGFIVETEYDTPMKPVVFDELET